MPNDLMYPVCENWEFGQGHGCGTYPRDHSPMSCTLLSIDGDGYGFGDYHGWHTGWGYGAGIHQMLGHVLGDGHGYGFEYYQLNKFTITI